MENQSFSFPVGTLPQGMVEELATAAPTATLQTLDPALFVSSAHNSTAEIQLTAQATGYTKALNRAAYERTSVHCASESITVLVSNYPNPGDTDWYTAGTGNFVSFDYPVKWVRVQATAGTKVYVQSARYLYE